MIRLLVAIFVLSSPALADSVLAARTIPAKSIIGPDDVVMRDATVPGAATDPGTIIGMEAKVALFAGRPIRQGDVSQPAVVERNQLIKLHYQHNGLVISTDARSLGRAGPGDLVRVMNLNSRATITALIGTDGMAYAQR